MKKSVRFIVILASCFFTGNFAFAQVGIGTSTPERPLEFMATGKRHV